MKTTETILLIGLGGVIAYLAFGRKSDAGTKSLGGGSRGGSSQGGFEDSTKSLESIDVIETKPPINVTVNTNSSVPTPAEPEPTTPPPPPTTEPETVPDAPSAAFNGRRRNEGYSESFVILDNTSFPIHRAYNGDDDVDCY